ncbi:hypothetical protein RVB5_02660 [Pseudomonas aeruginosa]
MEMRCIRVDFVKLLAGISSQHFGQRLQRILHGDPIVRPLEQRAQAAQYERSTARGEQKPRGVLAAGGYIAF